MSNKYLKFRCVEQSYTIIIFCGYTVEDITQSVCPLQHSLKFKLLITNELFVPNLIL